MKKIKIALIIAIGDRIHQLPLVNMDVPPAFGYLKSYLDKNLPSLTEIILIHSINDINIKEIDVLGISSYTPSFKKAIDIAKKAKIYNPNIKICLGGPHISSLPMTLPKEIDFGIIGDGEITFKEIIETLINLKNKDNLKTKLKNIPGLVLWDENNNLFLTNQREPTLLDNLPFYDKTLSYHDKKYDTLNITLFTSRGCPYKCNFCAVNHKYRLNSADYIISEIEQSISIYPKISSVAIRDDLFIINKKRLIELIEKIEQKKLNKKLTFGCNVRADLVNEELCKLLKRMNVKAVNFGAESASDRILSKLKTGIKSSDNQKALDLLYKYNITASCTFICGVPGETTEDLLLNLQFILNNLNTRKMVGPVLFILTPLPGTYYWNFAKQKKLIPENDNEINWDILGDMTVGSIPNLRTFEEWRNDREGFGIYLNNEFIPEKHFYDLLEQYDKELSKIPDIRNWINLLTE